MWHCMYCKRWHEDKESCPDIWWQGCLPPLNDDRCQRRALIGHDETTNKIKNNE